jgi:Tol biopolymer transport system component
VDSTTKARDERIRALYEAALACPAAGRASFVAEQSGGDVELRSSVESLLSRREATDFGGASVSSGATSELPAGTSVGNYRIDAVIGRGGMGIVYRASDTKLKRPVAMKFLSAALADVQARRRFEQEAETASGLNHPHIVTVHDVGEHASAQFIVSELVDGGTLGDWAMRPRTWRQCVDLLTGVADAIAAAHAAGVLHRDIKPGNILIGNNGYAKLADFGLAKLSDRGSAGTQASPSTGAGVVIGTVAYMSPEQAAGQPTDARSDVFSFGAVLYELLAGRRPFEGATDLEVLKTIVHGEPVPLPATVPDALRTVVEKALEKDPAERYQHMQDMVVDLRRVARKASGTSSGSAIAVAAPKTRRWYPWLAGIGVAVLVVALGVPAAMYFFRTPPQANELRFEISAPGYTGSLAVSPKGDRIAYTALVGGKKQIWIRPFDTSDARALPGTDGAAGVFWSPDGQRLGFIADGKLKKIDVSGGPAQALVDGLLVNTPGSWGRDGTILFSSSSLQSGTLSVIGRVAESGGTASAVTKFQRQGTELTEVHGLPIFLDDGDHFLYGRLIFDGNAPREIAVNIASLSGQRETTLARLDRTQGAPSYGYAAGYLLSKRENQLVAQQLDARSQTVKGSIVPVASNARDFSASANGILVYTTATPDSPSGNADRRLTWFDRRGEVVGHVDVAQGASNASLSPDQRRIIFNTPAIAEADVWILDLDRGAATRRTFGPRGNTAPLWSPDGSEFVFNSNRSSTSPNQIYERAANGTGSDVLLCAGEPGELLIPSSWSPDGRFIFFGRTRFETLTEREDVWMLSVADKKPAPLIESNVVKEAARLSPDGRWLAYTAKESGVRKIVVQPFPDVSGGKWELSPGGGMEPRWRADGKELFYLGLDGMLMAVEVQSGEVLEYGAPQPLFQTGIPIPSIPLAYYYDVAADGQRFLVNAVTQQSNAEQDAPPARITVVVNWTALPPSR